MWLDRKRESCSYRLMGRSAGKASSLTSTTLRSCESEYLAITGATQEASYVRQLQIQKQGPTIPLALFASTVTTSLPWIWSIFLSTIPQANTLKFAITLSRTSVFVDKEIGGEKIPSEQTRVDMLTKHASMGVVQYNKKLVGMTQFISGSKGWDISAQFCLRKSKIISHSSHIYH